MMNRYSIKKFAELIDVTSQTLRNWDMSGRLKSATANSKVKGLKRLKNY